MTDKLSEYGYGFQVKVIAAMFTDRAFLQQIADIIQPDYFESDSNIWLLEIIIAHFREYKTPPSKDVLKVKVTEISDDVLKTAILEQLKEVFRFMESDDLSFVKDEILKFCKNQEIKQAIMDSVGLLKMGNYDEIKSSYVKTGRGSPEMYLTVNKNLRGYAGVCLPKDTLAIRTLLKKLKLNFKLIQAIDSDNGLFKKTVFKGMRIK